MWRSFLVSCNFSLPLVLLSVFPSLASQDCDLSVVSPLPLVSVFLVCLSFCIHFTRHPAVNRLLYSTALISSRSPHLRSSSRLLYTLLS